MLLEVASTARSCSKVAKHNLDMPKSHTACGHLGGGGGEGSRPLKNHSERAMYLRPIINDI